MPKLQKLIFSTDLNKTQVLAILFLSVAIKFLPNLTFFSYSQKNKVEFGGSAKVSSLKVCPTKQAACFYCNLQPIIVYIVYNSL